VRYLFPTVALEVDLVEFGSRNESLLAKILVEARTAGGIRRSAVGGWQSGGDIFTRDWPELHDLRILIEAAATAYLAAQHSLIRPADIRFRVSGWANILRSGDYHRPHTHPGATISGAYYVDAAVVGGKHPASGLLELCDPRTAGSEIGCAFGMGGQRELILPRTGLLVLFPSALVHYVNPCGDDTRVALGLNVHVEGLCGGKSESRLD
jgi:uncharacterized protein (TIGR02466 family)